MIQVENLTKQFHSKKSVLKVLDNNTWTAQDGAITGFIGHNGAGKTTTLKIMTGAIRPTNGRILLNGIDIKENPYEAKRQFGFVSDSPDHFLRLKGIEYLNFIADVYDVPHKSRAPFIKEYSERFDIAGVLDKTILSYSHGMRQKLMILGALIHEPPIWILDEPLTGLDPQAAFELKKMMKEHTAKGYSVLFSTHILEVAEKLCDQIVIIKKGIIKFDGTLNELQLKYPDDMTLEDIFLDINKEVDTNA